MMDRLGRIIFFGILFGLSMIWWDHHNEMARSQPVITPPVFIPPTAAGPTLFTPLHTYYMSATGSNSNNGLTPATAWRDANHTAGSPVGFPGFVCGDVVRVLPGTYNGNYGVGPVTNCPSTSGGVDGTGGINMAIILCDGPNLSSCDFNYTGNPVLTIFEVDENNWSVQNLQIHGGQSDALLVDGQVNAIHHHAFVNNVVFNVGVGLDAKGTVSHAIPPTDAYDYTAFIGNLVQNSEQSTVCTAAIVMVDPGQLDTLPGTHFLYYGNISHNNTQPIGTGCAVGGLSDIENYMMDTWDAHGITNQTVQMNNIGWTSTRMSFQNFIQNIHPVTGLHMYQHNNTSYNGYLLNDNPNQADFLIQMDNSSAPFIEVFRNVILGTQSMPCALQLGGGSGPSSLVNIKIGATGNENIAFNPSGSNVCIFNGGPAGVNFTINPNFNNTTDLINNQSGPPDCHLFTNVTVCAGYNANSMALANPSIIFDLTPTCAQCTGKGYQLPSTTCATTGDVATFFPTWLKGVVNLRANQVDGKIYQYHDLVTTPCGL